MTRAWLDRAPLNPDLDPGRKTAAYVCSKFLVSIRHCNPVDRSSANVCSHPANPRLVVAARPIVPYPNASNRNSENVEFPKGLGLCVCILSGHRRVTEEMVTNASQAVSDRRVSTQQPENPHVRKSGQEKEKNDRLTPVILISKRLPGSWQGKARSGKAAPAGMACSDRRHG